MGRRKTRYDEGGIIPGDGVQDFDPEELAKAGKRDLQKEIREMQEARSSEGSEPIYNEVGDVVKGMRRNTETGQTYYTDETPVKKETVKAAPKVKAATGSGRSTGRGGPTAAEMAKYYSEKKSSRAEIPGTVSGGNEIGQTKSEQLERKVKDNALKALAATGVVGGAAGVAFKLKKMRDAAKQLFDKEVAKKFSAPQAREVGKPYKRGGVTKSSASSRADGCAVRGKTRGRMY
jgi:hypothetical protein